jgi:predicted ATPase
MQFTRLKLLNWMNFSTVDVSLAQRTFLVGPNASGKSNLLSAFRFLRDIARGRGGGFVTAVEDRGGVASLRSLIARRNSSVEMDVRVSTPNESPGRHAWRYRIVFNADTQKRPILKSEEIWKNEDKLLDRPDASDKNDPYRLRQTHLEQLNVNQRFRELCDFFDSIQYVHFVPHIIREPERYAIRKDDPYGGDFLAKLAQMRPKDLRERLRKIEKLLEATVPQLKKLRLAHDRKGIPHLMALYEHWRPQGAWQDERQFSDGTLRLVGFLWALLEGKGPLLLEEPELSLHPGIVRRLSRLVQRLQKIADRRQVLISTHSPDLLLDKGIGADEVLMLEPGAEGTRARVGRDDDQIRTLMEEGASAAEVVIPATEPNNARQLEHFPG